MSVDSGTGGSAASGSLPIVSANFLYAAVGAEALRPQGSRMLAGLSGATAAWLCANGLVPVKSRAGLQAMTQKEWYLYQDICRCQAVPGSIGSEVAA
jgi:hypothetical protein